METLESVLERVAVLIEKAKGVQNESPLDLLSDEDPQTKRGSFSCSFLREALELLSTINCRHPDGVMSAYRELILLDVTDIPQHLLINGDATGQLVDSWRRVPEAKCGAFRWAAELMLAPS